VTQPVPTTAQTAAKLASMDSDQVNTAGWDKAWTNLLNVAEQSFTPSLPKLLGVEVELVVANPGEAEDELIGFIAGAGIVVRNAIILVDFIELRRAQGMSWRMPSSMPARYASVRCC